MTYKLTVSLQRYDYKTDKYDEEVHTQRIMMKDLSLDTVEEYLEQKNGKGRQAAVMFKYCCADAAHARGVRLPGWPNG